MDAANDVRLAARRFGFTRKANIHPFDQIEDPRLAAAGTAAAIAGMDGPLTEAELKAMGAQARLTLNASAEEASDIAAFGHWLSGQGGASDEAARRLAKRVKSLAGQEAGPDLERYCRLVSEAGGPLTDVQNDVLSRIVKTFG